MKAAFAADTSRTREQGAPGLEWNGPQYNCGVSLVSGATIGCTRHGGQQLAAGAFTDTPGWIEGMSVRFVLHCI